MVSSRLLARTKQHVEMIGARIGHYRIESQVGAGGMGVVYRAFDSRLERHVAIKVFPGLETTPKARQRLLHEARSASALNHPNVCTVHEVGESGDITYLVMEFVEGHTLSAALPSGGFSMETIVDYGSQIAGALAHAHARGVVHRDLKGANVVVTPDGRHQGARLRRRPAPGHGRTNRDGGPYGRTRSSHPAASRARWPTWRPRR